MIDKHFPALRQWHGGSDLSARHLNESVDAIERMRRGVKPPQQVRTARVPGEAAAAGAVAQFKILLSSHDYITCAKWDGSTRTGSFKVAKPWFLRKTPFDGPSLARAGITYSYGTFPAGLRSARALLADDSVLAWQEQIIPAYAAGDIMYAVHGIIGGVGVTYLDAQEEPTLVEWLDVNVDGRMWGEVF